jgi:hypothetical protein
MTQPKMQSSLAQSSPGKRKRGSHTQCRMHETNHFVVECMRHAVQNDQITHAQLHKNGGLPVTIPIERLLAQIIFYIYLTNIWSSHVH